MNHVSLANTSVVTRVKAMLQRDMPAYGIPTAAITALDPGVAQPALSTELWNMIWRAAKASWERIQVALGGAVPPAGGYDTGVLEHMLTAAEGYPVAVRANQGASDFTCTPNAPYQPWNSDGKQGAWTCRWAASGANWVIMANSEPVVTLGQQRTMANNRGVGPKLHSLFIDYASNDSKRRYVAEAYLPGSMRADGSYYNLTAATGQVKISCTLTTAFSAAEKAQDAAGDTVLVGGPLNGTKISIRNPDAAGNPVAKPTELPLWNSDWVLSRVLRQTFRGRKGRVLGSWDWQ